MAAHLLLSTLLLQGPTARAGDILWYTGDGGSTVGSLATLEAAAGVCSAGVDQTPRWPTSLTDYRLVFLSVTSDPLSSSQQADVAAYLDAGRTLVLVGDSAWFNVPHVAAYNSLLAGLKVGSRFVSGVSYDSGCGRQASRTTAVPLTEGVKAITYAYSGAITPAKDATVLLTGESGQALAVAHDSLVLVADINIFEESCPMGPGNAVFFSNLYRGACPVEGADEDGDGFVSAACGGDDCDDRDAERYPDRAWYPDADGDGLGDPAQPTLSCCAPPDLIDNGEDCDDTDPDILWGDLYFADQDGDGHGDPDEIVRACAPPSDTAPEGDDCDDTDPDIHPDAAEVCNDRDDNCDGTTDEDDALDAVTWHPDADGDGHGAPEVLGIACAPPDADAVASEDDCDDTDPDIHPDAAEVCNGIDDNCDGGTDEGLDCAAGEPDPMPTAKDAGGCGGRQVAGLLGLGLLGWRRRRQ